jgi:hypothetical protein
MAASIRPSQNQNRQINPLPLRRTSWYYHSYHSLLGFTCSHTASAGPCWFLLSRCLDTRLGYLFTWLVLSISPDSHGLLSSFVQFIRFILVDHCRFFRLPRTLHVAHSSGPSGSSSTPRLIVDILIDSLFAWPHVVCIDSHGLLIQSLCCYLHCGPSGSSPTPRFILTWSLLSIATTTDFLRLIPM